MLLSSFNPLYLEKIWCILNTIACANHVIVKKKKERWLNGYEYFSVYTFPSPVF